VAAVNRPVDLFLPGEMTGIAEGSISSDERQRLADKATTPASTAVSWGRSRGGAYLEERRAPRERCLAAPCLRRRRQW